MLVRKSEISLPAAISDRFVGVDVFDAATDGETIFLRPSENTDDSDIAEQIERLGITEQDIEEAIAWARSHA